MPQTDSSLTRSIWLAGLIRWLIAAAGMIAIGAAFVAGQLALALAGLVFLVGAVTLAYRARRAHQEAQSPASPKGLQ